MAEWLYDFHTHTRRVETNEVEQLFDSGADALRWPTEQTWHCRDVVCDRLVRE